MAERFYVNCPLQPGLLTLEGAEAHHVVVYRLRPGDAVCLFNGDGQEYPAHIVRVARRDVELDVLPPVRAERELPARLWVAAPLPKGDRAQFLIEKLTELGVQRFVPLQTARSVVHPGEAKVQKLERYVIEASKQCGRNVLMEVDSLATWEDFCIRADLPAKRVVAHPNGADQMAWVSEDTVLAVGPEGGLTDQEIDRGRQAGWKVAGLGPRILRIETAAIALAALCSQGH